MRWLFCLRTIPLIIAFLIFLGCSDNWVNITANVSLVKEELRKSEPIGNCHVNNKKVRPKGSPAASIDFDGQIAMRHIETQTGFGPRSPENPNAKLQTLSYIRSQIPSSMEIQLHKFNANGFNGTNLWVSSRAAKKKSTTLIMLGTHWDTRSQADRDTDITKRNMPVLGANDGASGVAVLIEIAKHLHKQPPEINVDLIFF